MGRESFYGLLASLRGRLFRDAEFAEFYCPDNGRDSVPPSLLATALLLQSHDKVSDAEAKARAALTSGGKWRWGLRRKTGPSPRTLQVFRAQLILHEFVSSLQLARESVSLSTTLYPPPCIGPSHLEWFARHLAKRGVTL